MASILSQNPAIYASPNSPLVELLVNVNRHLGTTEQARAFLQPTQIDDVLKHALAGFYNFTDRPIVVDKSRAWPNPENLALLERVTTAPVTCIVMVRDLTAVLASFVRKIHENPDQVSFIDKALKQAGRACTDVERAEWLLAPGGTIYESWQSLQQGYASPWRRAMHFVEYDDLVHNPESTLRQLYDAIGEPAYSHNLDAIENLTPEDDTVYGIPGLHEVRPQLRATAPDPRSILSPELYAHCQATPHFWRTPQTVQAVTHTPNNPLHLSPKPY